MTSLVRIYEGENMQTWQMQEAKAQLSELVKRARSQPRDITLHGKSVAVVVSREAFDRLSQAQGSLVEFMLWG
jgi:prevent-host-death family protein